MFFTPSLIIILPLLGLSGGLQGDAHSLSKRQVLNELRVTTIEYDPYLRKREVGEGQRPPTGNDRYEGFIKDILDALSGLTGVRYTLTLVQDGMFGQQQPDGSWSGMIGEVQTGRAHIAAAPLTITPTRQQVVSFLQPFQRGGVTVIIKKPTITYETILDTGNLGYLLRPFHYGVWLLIILIFILVWIGLILINVFNPYEWKIAARHGEVLLKEEDNFNPPGACWFLWSTLMWQGFITSPRSYAGRVLVAFWWVFVIFSLISYTAALVGVLLTEQPYQEEIVKGSMAESFRDLVEQNQTTFAPLSGGSTELFFRHSTIPLYQKAYNKIQGFNITVQSAPDGIDKVKNEDFALITESTFAEYTINQDCSLRLLGGRLNSFQYGFAVRRDFFEMEVELNDALQQLLETGRINLLYNKWWKAGNCPASTDALIDGKQLQQYHSRLGLLTESILDHNSDTESFDDEKRHIPEGSGSLFEIHVDIVKFSLAPLLMLIGFIITIITCAVEMCCYRKRSRKEVVTPTKEAPQELATSKEETKA